MHSTTKPSPLRMYQYHIVIAPPHTIDSDSSTPLERLTFFSVHFSTKIIIKFSFFLKHFLYNFSVLFQIRMSSLFKFKSIQCFIHQQQFIYFTHSNSTYYTTGTTQHYTHFVYIKIHKISTQFILFIRRYISKKRKFLDYFISF